MAANQPSLTENTTTGSLHLTAKYPYCVPSYDPTTVHGPVIEKWLEDGSYFGETDCDIYEIEGGQATWKMNMNDAQMQEYLHVLTFLSNPFVYGKKLAEKSSPIEKT